MSHLFNNKIPTGSNVSVGSITASSFNAPFVSRLLVSKSISTAASTSVSLFTVPANYCVVTNFILRNPTATLATGVISFGYNSTATDVVTTQALTTITGTTLSINISPIAGNVVGTAAAVLSAKMVTPVASQTITIDVIGYLTA